jgi:hypothetical protein
LGPGHAIPLCYFGGFRAYDNLRKAAVRLGQVNCPLSEE